jgi:hypothetical protein
MLNRKDLVMLKRHFSRIKNDADMLQAYQNLDYILTNSVQQLAVKDDMLRRFRAY